MPDETPREASESKSAGNRASRLRYGILLYPAANRVYAEASRHLSEAELAVFSSSVLSTPVLDVREELIGGVPYLTFSTTSSLTEEDIALLSNLSALYVLFEISSRTDSSDEPIILRPIGTRKLDKFDSDLLTVQKYSGKTNELFTKLLLNVTLLSTDRPVSTILGEKTHVLDPLCGRGTTLNQAMMYGYNATGLDVDTKDFEAYQHFIKTWLRNKRVKHTAESGVLRANKARLGNRLDIHFGLTKEQYKAGETRNLKFFNCDTKNIHELVQPCSVDVIVTDAPYGVQHGSHAGQKNQGTHTLSRSPRDLLAKSVPLWTRALRPGGALGISWNTHVLPRKELTNILSDAGLIVRTDGAFEGFQHRVDQSILRDLIVAKKPA